MDYVVDASITQQRLSIDKYVAICFDHWLNRKSPSSTPLELVCCFSYPKRISRTFFIMMGKVISFCLIVI